MSPSIDSVHSLPVADPPATIVRMSKRSQTPSRLSWFLMTAIALFAWCSAVPVYGQEADGGGGGAGPIEIRVESFGIGNVSRDGALTGLRLNVNFAGTDPRRVRVVWSVPDADGDLMDISREITLNPGPNPVWLYGPLPYRTSMNRVWEVAVDALDEKGRVDERLAAINISQGQSAEADSALIGVVGLPLSNLKQYEQVWPTIGGGRTEPATGHERTRILNGLTPAELPDRWMGLDVFEAIVWADGDPMELSLQQAEAIQEWVMRGGNLVVVLPQVGDVWKSTLLDPIVPQVSVSVWEDQEIRDTQSAGGILRHLSRYRTALPSLPLNRPYPRVNLHLFAPRGVGEGGATPDEWNAIDTIPMMTVDVPIENEDGSRETRTMAVVVRRDVGFGHVTFVGVPVTDTRLQQPGLGLPNAEVFWNPILGRRCDTPDQRELNTVLLDQKNMKPQIDITTHIDLGDSIIPLIQLTAQAGGGVLLALVLFIAYWLVAGPGVFAYLKTKGLTRYSWMAFVVAVGVFTAVGWVGARMLRVQDTLPRALTVLDFIAGGEWQRTTTYVTVVLDGYGTQQFEVKDPDVDSTPWHDVMYAVQSQMSGQATFPDQRRYDFDAGHPNTLAFPARNTSKQIKIRQLGPPRRDWGMPTYIQDADRPRAVYRTIQTGNLTQKVTELRGVLEHDLPDTLRNATIYHVTSRPVINPDVVTTRADGVSSGRPRLQVYAWKLGNWFPGTPIDLSSPASFTHNVDALFWQWSSKDKGMQHLLRQLPASDRFTTAGRLNWTRARQRAAIELLGMFGQITPITWVGTVGEKEQRRCKRTRGQEWDMSSWFTRPCLIITGYIDGGECATPIQQEEKLLGETDPASLTLVRWVYPLPLENP